MQYAPGKVVVIRDGRTPDRVSIAVDFPDGETALNFASMVMSDRELVDMIEKVAAEAMLEG